MFTDPEGLNFVSTAGVKVAGKSFPPVRLMCNIYDAASLGTVAILRPDLLPEVIKENWQDIVFGDTIFNNSADDKSRPRKNIEVRHKSRKEAKEAAQKPGKPLPEPPKNGDPKKRKAFDEQKKYKFPESHPNSDYPDPHFHDSNKSSQPVNRHHTFPKR